MPLCNLETIQQEATVVEEGQSQVVDCGVRYHAKTSSLI